MDDRYYLAAGSEQKGPYTFSQLQSMWRSGAITADTLYCQQGFDEWVSISSLAQLLDGQPMPAPSPAQHPALAALESDKRILPALILCFFFGILGIHAFYAGRPRQGILFLAFPVLAFLGNDASAAGSCRHIASVGTYFCGGLCARRLDSDSGWGIQGWKRTEDYEVDMTDYTKEQANKITGANAGGPRQLPIRTRWAARVAQFC